MGGKLPLLVAVGVLAIGTRLVFAVLTTSWVFPRDNNSWAFGHEMGQIAASLAMGNGFSWPENVPYAGFYRAGQPTAWMPPVYPFLMAGVFKIFGIFSEQAAMALEFFQTIVSALTCVVLYFVGKRLYNAKAGLVAAFLFAMYPPAIHFAVQKTWSTSLFACCLLLIILMFLRRADHPHVRGGILLGFMLGFTALVDPVIIGTYPFALVWLFLKAEGDRRTIAKMMVAMLITCFLCISPWLIRNYFVFGQFVLIKSNLGNELFKGNNEYATGNIRLRSEREFTDAEQAYLNQSDEVARNRFLFGKAFTFIKEHPQRFARLTMSRFIYYWTFTEGSLRKIWVPLAAYFAVLTLAIIGLILSRAGGKDVQFMLLFLLSFPLPYYFTVVGLLRYRFPLEPLLMVFAAYALQWLGWRWKILSIPPTISAGEENRQPKQTMPGYTA
jgi:4-amino-4-deoxy-L-arabinose transferase-like glycosyltransferase